MRFLRRPAGDDDPAAEQRRQRSEELVAAGGIPLDAQERIARQSQPGAVWTSDLSVDELAALRGMDYEPVAQVLGSSLYRVGWVNTGWLTGMGARSFAWGTVAPQENAALTESLFQARALALNRLVMEAQGLGAEGVVGVRLSIRRWEWAMGMAEFTVLGTAVRQRGVAPPKEPFTSTLSGQDMARLLRTGHRPLRLVMGASAQQAVAIFGGMLGGYGTVSNWSNQEVRAYSQAMHQAQHNSRQRMAAEAGRAGAHGVVGVQIDSSVLEYPMGSESVQGRIVQWVVLGTAVAEAEARGDSPRPAMLVHLNDGGSDDVRSTIP